MPRVIVASKNPVKIEAVRVGLAQCFPNENFEVTGVSCESGVPDQPVGDAETRRGAENRAAAAQAAEPNGDFWIGIEGGIETNGEQMLAFAWIMVRSNDQTGCARSGAFQLPPRVQALVREGKELGEANDIVFAQHNSKQKGGAIGLLTGDVIGRQQLYEHAMVLALVPFVSTDHFPPRSARNCERSSSRPES